MYAKLNFLSKDSSLLEIYLIITISITLKRKKISNIKVTLDDLVNKLVIAKIKGSTIRSKYVKN